MATLWKKFWYTLQIPTLRSRYTQGEKWQFFFSSHNVALVSRITLTFTWRGHRRVYSNVSTLFCVRPLVRGIVRGLERMVSRCEMKFSVRAFVSCRIIGRRELNCFRGRHSCKSSVLNASKSLSLSHSLSGMKYTAPSATRPTLMPFAWLHQTRFPEFDRTGNYEARNNRVINPADKAKLVEGKRLIMLRTELIAHVPTVFVQSLIKSVSRWLRRKDREGVI